MLVRRHGWPSCVERFGWLDHAIRAYQHFTTVKGNRLAAAVTYFGFLSLFPLLAIAFAAFGIVLANNPDVEQQVFDAIGEALPGFVGGEDAPINPETLKDAATTAGIIGAVLCCSPAPAWSMRFAKRCTWSGARAT